ncbi:MAG: hypothetical protein ACKPKO_06075, partial [Candidatus Fonsibacter sp.]
ATMPAGTLAEWVNQRLGSTGSDGGRTEGDGLSEVGLRIDAAATARLHQWVEQHTLVTLNRGTPRSWRWDLVLWAWALEEAGIHRLAVQEPDEFFSANG